MNNNREKSFIKNTIIIFLSKFCTQFLSFFLLPLFTSLLSTEEYGYFDLYSTYAWLLAIFLTLQLENGMFRFLIDERENEKGIKRVISNGIAVIVIQLIFFIGIYFAGLKILNIKNIRYIFMMTIATSLLNLMLQITRGLGKNIEYSIASIISGVLNVIFSFVFIKILALKLLGIVLAYVIANFIAAIYLFFKIKLYKYLDFKILSKKEVKELMMYSFPLIPNSISSWIMNISDKVMISFLLGVSFNGIYSISTKFSILLSHVYTVFSLSWTESASMSTNDTDRSNYFSKVINKVFLICSFIGLIVLSAMPIIFKILIEEAYFSAYNYIPILILASFFELFSILLGGVFIALKLPKEIATTTIIGGIINITINFLFLKKYGLSIACISTLMSYMYIAMIRYIKITKHVKIKLEYTKYILVTILYVISVFLYYYQSSLISIISIFVFSLIFIKVNYNHITDLIKKVLKC
mgnify:FL=1